MIAVRRTCNIYLFTLQVANVSSIAARIDHRVALLWRPIFQEDIHRTSIAYSTLSTDNQTR